MSYGIKCKWILVAVLINVFVPANVQFAPMYMPGAPPPVFAVPAPMPIGVAIHLPEPTTKTTTTTTTPASVAIAVPVPVPMPMAVQFAVPAQPPPVFCQGNPRPRSCPPCPPCTCMPSCTPAFFSYCSPCHQKCRCRNSEDAPVPMPPHRPVPVPGPAYPIPVPPPPPVMAAPPVVVIPLPPSRPLPLPPRRRRRRRRPPFISSFSSSDESSSCDSSVSSDSDWYNRGRRKFKRRRTRIFRRNANPASENSDSDLVKPIMSYICKNGEVKFKTEISSKEAMEILEGKTTHTHKKHKVKVNANDNSIVVSNYGGKSGRNYDEVLLRDSPNVHVLSEGKNKLIFKSPTDKSINNLAMSFQVT
ncbi:uncharacterized protein [Epargyreus clarus]|uniref:uncharacterized protein n=1 Tax=Epargyreus clarus TaxID=520877 RepID=UPI003C2B7586